ncbi:MAG TPA: CDF family Co(II)/Ni(II) efflux transporter DmeF [Planctomycetota bacterium]|nr:CDF family Co(II)/Ni(II) efflux transporter DmeF [Planctomycetota bacterium]
MHFTTLDRLRHDHAFGTEQSSPGERRTRLVAGLTAVFMAVEIACGMLFGSMALVADGWHMGTHAAAIGVAAYAYAFARRHATSSRFSFGTGKVGALAGFGSAVALALVALLIFGQSVARLVSPVAIRFDEAIWVAALGLGVNLASALLLRDGHAQVHAGHEHGHEHRHERAHAHPHHDRNLRAAYLHVLADALTSVLAIVALTAGKLLGWAWMDPAMGLVGSIVIATWSWELLRDTGGVLLDAELDEHGRAELQRLIEADADTRVADLHVWRVGPAHLAAIVSVVTHEAREPEHYKALLAGRGDLAHVTVEVHRCPGQC